jgi:hypothetical protein
MAEVSTTGFWYSEPFSDGRGAECSRGETSERNFGLKQLGTGLCYIRTVDLSRAFGCRNATSDLAVAIYIDA